MNSSGTIEPVATRPRHDPGEHGDERPGLPDDAAELVGGHEVARLVVDRRRRDGPCATSSSGR